MSEVRVDVSQLRALADELRAHSRESRSELVATVAKGALSIKNDWRARWTGLSHLPMLAASVTYDVYPGARQVRAEIGPDKGRPQGPLGTIAEFGTPRTAPRPGGAPALAAEEPRFVSAVERVAAGILG